MKRVFNFFVLLTLLALTFGALGTSPASAAPVAAPAAFSSPGTHTWTVPSGVTTVRVEAWGGGGKGGDAPRYRAGGGGGGAYSASTISVTPGTTYTVIVGQGSFDKATPGGDSSFKLLSTTYILAKGGTSVWNDYAGGGAGGQSTGGIALGSNAIKNSGGNGGATAFPNGGGGGASGGATGAGGNGTAPNGGVPATGGGGAAGGRGGTTQNMNGGNGGTPGGGGGGANNIGWGTAYGGYGGNGRVIISIPTTAVVSCTPTTMDYGDSSTCTATVTNTIGIDTPTGAINWTLSAGDSGSFTPAVSCVPSGSGNTASCSVTYTPGASGDTTHRITASYVGDLPFTDSSASQDLILNQYTVTFDANGGAGTMNSQVSHIPAALNLNTYTAPSGKAFAGWGEVSTGPLAYTNGATYSFANNITLYAQWAPAGNALDFDGSNDWVDATNNAGNKQSAAALGLPTKDITIEAWVYPRSYANYKAIASFIQHNSGTQSGWNLGMVSGNKFSFALAGDVNGLTYLSTTNTFLTNTWYHVAGVYDGTTMRIYVNGQLEGTSTAESGNIYYLNSWLALGMYKDDNEANSFPGTIDEVRVWNVARTQAEIQANMNNAIVPQAGLVAYYKLNHGVAGGTNTGITTAIDSSGNILNGTLNNFALTGATSNWVYGNVPLSVHTVTFSANGGVGANTTQTASVATNLTANAFTRAGYAFTGWNTLPGGGGTAYTEAQSYNFADDLILYAQWVDTFTISASAGANGTVTPSGDTTVNYGDSQSYAITPDLGYHIVDVLVDGSSVGAVASYDFTNVAANHTISATFANDAPTDIDLSNNSVAENQPGGTTVGTLSTTDPDAGASHTYSLGCAVSGADDASFQISGSDLQTNAVFDYETKNSYAICLRSDDGNGGTFDENFTVNVTNANEAPTDIDLSNNSVAENQPGGTTVGTLSTTDPDAGDTHTYSLACTVSGADDASFQVSGSDLQTNAIFDYETKISYAICLRTDDGNGETFDENFTINVTDANDAPTDIDLSNNSVAENQPSGTTVSTLSTTDPDAGDTHTYSLGCAVPGADDASFQISGSDLQTNAVFDYETKNSYAICLRSDDGNGGTYDEDFTVNVTDASEAPTDIGLSNNTVGENQPGGTTVGTLSTTDPDAGDTHTYSLGCAVPGVDDASFAVLGDALNTAAVFDYETKNSYDVCVRTDDGNGGTYEEDFTINVTDVNEAPTDIALSNNSVAEAQPVGTTVGNLSTTDPDPGDTHTYSLGCAVPGADDASFAVLGDALNTAAAFDYETKNTYAVCVRADDGNGGTYDEDFTVNVTDTNEAPTDIGLSNNTVGENQPIGTTVGTLTTTDPNDGDTHTYSLGCAVPGADDASFAVLGSALNTAAAFDYETKNTYDICVRTDDGNGGTYDEDFTVNVALTTTLVFRSNGTNEGTLRESSETSGIANFKESTNQLITVGDDHLKRQYKGVLDFDTSSIPDNAVITSARLQIRGMILSANVYAKLGNLVADMTNPFFGPSTALEYQDFRLRAKATNVGTFTRTTTFYKWMTLRVNNASLFAVDKTGHTQFRVRFTKDDSNDTLKDMLRFLSGNFYSLAGRPKLIITYYIP